MYLNSDLVVVWNWLLREYKLEASLGVVLSTELALSKFTGTKDPDLRQIPLPREELNMAFKNRAVPV